MVNRKSVFRTKKKEEPIEIEAVPALPVQINPEPIGFDPNEELPEFKSESVEAKEPETKPDDLASPDPVDDFKEVELRSANEDLKSHSKFSKFKKGN